MKYYVYEEGMGRQEFKTAGPGLWDEDDETPESGDSDGDDIPESDYEEDSEEE